MPGKFITFEGSEGCGKTTQIRLLKDWLLKKHIQTTDLREPGGTPIGESIRHLLKHDPAGIGMSPETELLLFEASRAELVRKRIIPELAEGKWVICDRFYDSTIVYQGIARKLGVPNIKAINEFAIAGTHPHITILLDLPAETARKRTLKRSDNQPDAPTPEFDRLDSESPEFYQTLRDSYLKLASEHPHRIHTLDASQTPEKLFTHIQKKLKHAFPDLRD